MYCLYVYISSFPILKSFYVKIIDLLFSCTIVYYLASYTVLYCLAVIAAYVSILLFLNNCYDKIIDNIHFYSMLKIYFVIIINVNFAYLLLIGI